MGLSWDLSYSNKKSPWKLGCPVLGTAVALDPHLLICIAFCTRSASIDKSSARGEAVEFLIVSRTLDDKPLTNVVPVYSGYEGFP